MRCVASERSCCGGGSARKLRHRENITDLPGATGQVGVVAPISIKVFLFPILSYNLWSIDVLASQLPCGMIIPPYFRFLSLPFSSIDLGNRLGLAANHRDKSHIIPGNRGASL